MPADALKCKECRTTYPLDARYVCERCFGPLEVAYRRTRLDAEELGAAIQAGPQHDLALRRLPAAARAAAARGAAGRLHAAGARRPAGRAAGAGRAVGQERRREPDALVQGPRRRRWRWPGRASWASDDRLRLDRQPRQRGRRPRRRRRAASPTSSSPPTSRSRRSWPPACTAPTWSPSGATTTTSTGCAPSSPPSTTWAFVNINMRPYYAEGSKTLAYEIAEQLGWEVPDRVVAPIASGSLFTKIARGFEEWIELGLVEGEVPTMNGAQAEGCSPVAQAFAAGQDVCRPVKPDTIAKSLAIGNPADGPYALDLARRTGGGDRRGDRRRDPGRHPAARRDDGDLHRDRRRGHDRGAGQARASAATSTRTSASCSTSPARA